MKMRIITNEEYDWLADLAHNDDAIMHWENMHSYVNDIKNAYHLSSSARVVRGYGSARFWNYYNATYRFSHVGFRPAIEDLPSDILPSDIPNGSIVVVGTLFMGGKPVRIPQDPTDKGDIMDYVPGTALFLKEALEDPIYMVTGIKDNSRVYVDRCLLKNISYEDITNALRKE